MHHLQLICSKFANSETLVKQNIYPGLKTLSKRDCQQYHTSKLKRFSFPFQYGHIYIKKEIEKPTHT